MRNYYPGLTILKRRTYSYKATVEALEKCDLDYGCEYCDRKQECDVEFKWQVTNRKGWSWRLRDMNAPRADTQGSGEPDKTGDWMRGSLPRKIKIYERSLLEIA